MDNSPRPICPKEANKLKQDKEKEHRDFCKYLLITYLNKCLINNRKFRIPDKYTFIMQDKDLVEEVIAKYLNCWSTVEVKLLKRNYYDCWEWTFVE